MIPIALKDERGKNIIINKRYIASLSSEDFNWKGELKHRTVITMVNGEKFNIGETIEKTSEILKLFKELAV